ncbi:MAG: TIGR02710 family CRISPR-associated protein, partial [Planctomycetota bacterium]
SHQPIVKSIEHNRPEFVVFLCSDDTHRAKGSYLQVIGEGNVLRSSRDVPGPDLPNIVTLAGLTPDRYRVVKIPNVDDLNTCYHEAVRAIQDLRQRFPDARVIVDYTGGTKSMTAGLAAAAIDDGQCEIQVVTGARTNLEKVQDGTEFARQLSIGDIYVRRQLELCRLFLQRFDYAAVVELLEDAARKHVSQRYLQTLEHWRLFALAFDAWDRFDHQSARDLLAAAPRSFPLHSRFANVLARDTGHGFELVEDLVRNAQRRAAQRRYDDAVGRFYRATELTAQIWLRKRHEIDTADVDLQRVPEAVRDDLATQRRSEGEPVRIGLLRAWDLIAAFPEDPLAPVFTEARPRLLNALEVRNLSLFAHGLRPITAEDYRRIAEFLEPWLNQAIDAATAALGKPRRDPLPQLPTELPAD